MRNTITKLITITIAVAAIAVIGAHRAAGQTHEVGHWQGFAPTLAGFIPGQTLRLSMANLSTGEEGIGSVQVQAYIYDSYGNLLSQTVPVEVPTKQFHSFDFKRDDLPARGEAGTGRLQVRAEIVCRYSGSTEPISPDRLLVSLEVFDTGSGGNYFTGTVTVSGEGF
jgi:hypothetical protein